jgi:hypothetical protein
MSSLSSKLHLIALAAAVGIASAIVTAPQPAHAAANMYISAPSTGDTDSSVTVDVMINTAGQSANAFEGTISYPSGILEGVRGTYAGTICTLPIIVPEPSGGTATFSCGRPAGFTGTGAVARIVLKGINQGTGVIGLSGCNVLANDGAGTNITGSCTGKGIAISTAEPPPSVQGPTPIPTATAPPATPTPAATRTPRPTKSPTPTPSATPVPTPTPDNRPSVTEETPTEPTPTPEVEPPPVASLGEPTPLPTPTPQEPVNQERRSVAQALQDILGSAGDLSILGRNATGVVALLLTTIPFLALALGIVFLAYRLYIMERRRRHTLDRLFEMQLAEFAALEGKLDLLAEKGSKGREQYREEFKKAKDHILRELKPEYGKKADIADLDAGTSEATPSEKA